MSVYPNKNNPRAFVTNMILRKIRSLNHFTWWIAFDSLKRIGKIFHNIRANRNEATKKFSPKQNQMVNETEISGKSLWIFKSAQLTF